MKIFVECNQGGGGQCQADEVRERVPEPKVLENKQADCSHHARVAGTRVQRDGHVAATRVQNTAGDDGAELSDQVFVAIGNDLQAAVAKLYRLKRKNKTVLAMESLLHSNGQ